MYVKETEWFKKQERKKASNRKVFLFGMLVTLLLLISIGVQRVFAMEMMWNRLPVSDTRAVSVSKQEEVFAKEEEMVKKQQPEEGVGLIEKAEEFGEYNEQEETITESETNQMTKEEMTEEKSAVTEEEQQKEQTKVMYLTFDDGPRKGSTEKILDVLKVKGMKATFFVIGENVERNPEIVKRIVEEGHGIGIHCYQHDYNLLYDSVDAYMEDFEKAKKVIYDTTGLQVKMFRFPGGSINDFNKEVYKDIVKETERRGYVYFDWNASMEDAVKKPSAEKIIHNATESTLGRKKVVMLGHDTVQATADCLDKLLEEFTEYEMRVLDETIVPVQF